MSKRLELIWPNKDSNKDKVLLGLDEDGKPIWGNKVSQQPLCSCQEQARVFAPPNLVFALQGRLQQGSAKRDN